MTPTPNPKPTPGLPGTKPKRETQIIIRITEKEAEQINTLLDVHAPGRTSTADGIRFTLLMMAATIAVNTVQEGKS